MSKVQVHDGSLRDMGQRFIGAWQRAGRGEPVHETRLTFLDLEAMRATLSPRRLDLLRHVRQQGATSTRSLACNSGATATTCMAT